MNSAITALSAIGIIASLGSIVCVPPEQVSKLFGKIQWSVVGIIGYCLIMATTSVKFATPVLAIIAGLITIGLIVKAVKIKLSCPICPFVWALNALIIIFAFV